MSLHGLDLLLSPANRFSARAPGGSNRRDERDVSGLIRNPKIAGRHSRKRKCRRPREFDDIEMLRKIMTLFWKNGFDGVSLSMIMKETKLQKVRLYAAFGDKRSIPASAKPIWRPRLRHFWPSMLAIASWPEAMSRSKDWKTLRHKRCELQSNVIAFKSRSTCGLRD